MIDGIHFIASNIGERVLITSRAHSGSEGIKMDLNVHRFHDKERTFNYELMDPYSLINPANANKLFSCKIKPPYIIKSNNIIYANDELLFIKKLVKDNWISYLRNDLSDYNKISTPSVRSEIIDFIKEHDSGVKVPRISLFERREEEEETINTYEGHLIKWTLKCKSTSFTLEASQIKSEPSDKQTLNSYVRKCKQLKNDDLFMITGKCVFLWTFSPPKDISAHYIWGVGRDLLDIDLEEIFNNPLAERFLPHPDFNGIIKAVNNESDENITKLCNSLLKTYIEENFFLAYHGKILMENLLMLDQDWLIEKLCESCIKNCTYNDKNGCYLQNIWLLSIIAQFYSELTQKNPAIV
ncbi:16410_t:CDS:1, partial [Racocetra persica]